MPTTRSPRPMRTLEQLTGVAERAVGILRTILIQGLDPAYSDGGEFMFDYWPTWHPWNQAESRVVASIILSNAEWRAVVRAFDVTVLQPRARADGLDIWGVNYFDCTVEGGLMASCSEAFE